MKGTEKQIAWANDIRPAAIARIKSGLEYSVKWLSENRDDDAKLPLYIAAVQSRANELAENEDSKFWIDNRALSMRGYSDADVWIKFLMPACKTVERA